MEIEYSRRFIKDFKKIPSSIKKSCLGRIDLFAKDQYHPLLHNHRLEGKLKDFYSININADWRIIFQYINKNKIYLVEIGTHSNLYDK